AGLEPATPGLGIRAPPSCVVLCSPGIYGIAGEKREGVWPPSHLVPARSASSRADWVQDWVQKELALVVNGLPLLPETGRNFPCRLVPRCAGGLNRSRGSSLQCAARSSR